MNGIKLFRFNDDNFEQLPSKTAPSEKNIHLLVERNLECLFGITLLGREYSTGRTHKGFIDSLGIDGEGCPVIIEYKRKSNENIITQGLFYLDWLLDHRAEFAELVKQKLGGDAAVAIDFINARLICVAASFSRFDERAIMQIEKSITLVKYEFFADDLLLLETTDNFILPLTCESTEVETQGASANIGMPASLQARFKNMNPDVESLYFSLLAFCEQLGEDISIKFLKHYVAMQREKNFTCIQPNRTFLKLWLNLEPESVELEPGFSRNVRDIGHHASGNLEVELRTIEDLEKAKQLLTLAYCNN